MVVLTLANQKVALLPNRLTWLEAIHRNNLGLGIIKSNEFHHSVFLEQKDTFGGFKFTPIPEDIMKARPLYTGTAGVIGASGKPFGKRVETECEYDGTKKLVVFNTEAWQKSLVDTLLLCDHGFLANLTPSLQLFNTKTGKPVVREEDVLSATELILKFNGKVRRSK